jgi:hypothetical protein
MLKTESGERPIAMQIFANTPEMAAEAAKYVEDLGTADILDFNMGCPAPKIVKNGEGSALMREPAKAFAILSAIRKAVKMPFTVKMRKGWDDDNVNVLEIAKLAEDWDGTPVPFTYLCGDHDFFGMIPVDLSSKNAFKVDDKGTSIATVDPRVPIFPLIQAYQKINGLEVAEDMDLSLNKWYGIKFDETNDITLGEKTAQEGVLNGADGTPIMKLVAIKDQAHWNWKPEAPYLWEFFQNFSR